MKKLLLVLMVVSMLVVAGSAFAADEAGHMTKTKPTIDETAKKAASAAATAAVDYAKTELATAAAKEAETKVKDLAKTSTTLSFLKNVDAENIGLIATDNVGGAQTSVYALTDAEQTAMNKAAGASDSQTLVEGAFVPKLENLEDGKAYIVPIKIDAAAMGDANEFDPDEFILFPLGASKGKADKGYAVVDGDGNEIKPSAVQKAGSSWSTKAYLVFVFKADSPLGILTTADALKGLEPLLPALGSTTTDNSALKNSGGGCAMGTSALAFVVLGAFVAMRKK